MSGAKTRKAAVDVPAPLTTEDLKPGDRVTYKKKVGTVLDIGGMGYVRLIWDGQYRRMDTPARFLTKVPAKSRSGA